MPALILALSMPLVAGCASTEAMQDQVIALDLSGPRPAVQVSIGGNTPEPWVFDTGAEGSMIDVARARAWGLPEQRAILIGSPAGGEPVEGFVTSVRDVSVGGVSVHAVEMTAGPPLVPLAGVLSPNIFTGQLVTVDFARAELRIGDRSTAPNSAGTPYASLGGGHALPAIGIDMGGRVFSALIDTGAPGGLTVPYSMASSLPLSSEPVQVGIARFMDGEHPRYRATLGGTVKVGAMILANPEIEFIDGLPFVSIGMGLLRRMSITLDPEARLTWAETSGRDAPG